MPRQHNTSEPAMYFSNFEQLPDEIILEICRYLSPFDVIDGLGQLNWRLDRTISHFRRHLDIHHLTLNQYRRWYSHLFSYTATDVIRLVLSNWNSPGQIRLFNQSIQHCTSLHHLFPQIQTTSINWFYQ